MKNEGFEVIDGQQRIRSLYEFAEGAFKLLDPKKDAKRAIRTFPADVDDENLDAVRGQPAGYGATDAMPAAGDDGGFSL